MLKRLRQIRIGAIALIGCAGLVVGAIVLVARQQHTAAEKYEAEREKRCADTFPSAWESEQQNACKHERDGGQNYLPWGYILVSWPEGITVWAIIATGFVIGWQAWETRKTAEASNRSIILQEVALRQWVNVIPLGIEISRALKNPSEISIQFEIQNRTDYLVRIKRLEYEFAPNIHAIEKFKVECDFPLVPRKREDNSAFPFTAKCVIDIGELAGWGKIFIVAGDITFLDCMEKERIQHFEDLYRGFADGRLERMKPESISTAEEKPENPN